MNETIKANENLHPIDNKEIWQMTKAEYEQQFGNPRKNSTVTGKFSRHRNAVETALNRGINVPDEVLKDYPELKEL